MKRQRTVQKGGKKGQETINLYTLNNDSSLSQELNDQEMNSENQSDSETQNQSNIKTNSIFRLQKQHNSKLLKLEERNYALELKLRQITQQNQLLKFNMQTHEKRQKQIIKKVAFLQVTNQQISGELHKTIKFNRQKQEQTKNVTDQKKQLKIILKKINQQKSNFVIYFQKILKILQKSSNSSFQTQKQKMVEYLNKITKQNSNEKQKQLILDYNYQFDRLNFIKQQKTILQQQVTGLKHSLQKVRQQKNQSDRQFNQLKSTLQKQKFQKKKVIMNYSQQVDQLKQKIHLLTKKIEDQQERNQNRIKNILQDKNTTIEKLKSKIKQSRRRQDSFYERDRQAASNSFLQSKKNKKKSFIGDGSQDDYLEQIKLSTINRQIQKLEKELLIQFQS